MTIRPQVLLKLAAITPVRRRFGRTASRWASTRAKANGRSRPV
ncbi:MAG TPA: hypothetical protein VHD32_12030 [Candidatus Didemnitutus sp.]|nr:hypothetical protein [Candidatus Didemnitutus sp.]